MVAAVVAAFCSRPRRIFFDGAAALAMRAPKQF
jgi:hypothetical protein